MVQRFMVSVGSPSSDNQLLTASVPGSSPGELSRYLFLLTRRFHVFKQNSFQSCSYLAPSRSSCHSPISFYLAFPFLSPSLCPAYHLLPSVLRPTSHSFPLSYSVLSTCHDFSFLVLSIVLFSFALRPPIGFPPYLPIFIVPFPLTLPSHISHFPASSFLPLTFHRHSIHPSSSFSSLPFPS